VNYLTSIPCGDTVPLQNPHAISVSLPTIADVCGYEEHTESVIQKLKSAYPRFRRSQYVNKVVDYVKRQKGLPESYDLIPVCSKSAVELISRIAQIKLEWYAVDDICFIQVNHDSPHSPTIKSIIQNIGLIPSSRKAEHFLFSNLVISGKFDEKKETVSPSLKIREKLAEAYQNTTADNIYLCNTGMNAIYSAFEGVRRIQKRHGRNIFVQLGWLYLDTMEIVEKYGDEKYVIQNVGSMEELGAWLKIHGHEVAGVITEVPLNPQIKVFDLPRLSQLAGEYNFPVIIDATMGTPFNVETIEYCDIVVESLTKFASGNADLLMGAVIVKNRNRLPEDVNLELPAIVETPFIGDIERLAWSIGGYEKRVRAIASNTALLITELKKQKHIAQLLSVLENDSVENFRKISKGESCIPGVISIVFDKELRYYYDRMRLPKGPSFGTEFTLAMPYIYLAHYELIKSTEGRKKLADINIHPELLRISVGTENIEELIKVFTEIA
jgi:cystathionine gamma-synthase